MGRHHAKPGEALSIKSYASERQSLARMIHGDSSRSGLTEATG
jgi:hypothetical protein